MGWKKVSADFFQFSDENSVLEGRITQRGEIEIEGRMCQTYMVLTKDGLRSFLGSTQLDPLLQEIEDGVEMQIVYTGTVKSKADRDVKQFDVSVWEGE